MKKMLILVIVGFLLQSCFSYKVIENKSENYQEGKSYRIQQNYTTDVVRIKTKSDNVLVVDNKFEEQQIPLKSITKVERRTFSVLKTIGLPAVVIAGLVLLFVLAY